MGGPVLSRFDGSKEHVPPSRRARRPPSGPRAIDTRHPGAAQRSWWFALEHPRSLPRPETDDVLSSSGSVREIAVLTYDQQLLATAPVTQAIRYVQRSTLANSFASGSDTDRRDNLQLPRRNPRTVEFARERKSRAASDRAFIAEVLDWFRKESFVYTLAPPLLEGDTVDAFLFDTRRGFCEHYAGAFVVLLRAAGIPARVVTGYQGGEINPNGDYMIVRDSDAHAWAEALIDGVWQRFDPTAAVAPSRWKEVSAPRLPQGEPVPYLARLDMTWLKSLRLHWDAVNYQWQRGVVGFNLERQRDWLRDFGLGGARPWQIVAFVAAVAFAWGAAILGFARCARAGRSCGGAVVATLPPARTRRPPRRPDEGPLAYAQRAASRWPQWSGLLQRSEKRMRCCVTARRMVSAISASRRCARGWPRCLGYDATRGVVGPNSFGRVGPLRRRVRIDSHLQHRVARQPAHAQPRAQLVERFGLDLPHTLARHAEPPASCSRVATSMPFNRSGAR